MEQTAAFMLHNVLPEHPAGNLTPTSSEAKKDRCGRLCVGGSLHVCLCMIGTRHWMADTVIENTCMYCKVCMKVMWINLMSHLCNGHSDLTIHFKHHLFSTCGWDWDCVGIYTKLGKVVVCHAGCQFAQNMNLHYNNYLTETCCRHETVEF